MKFQDLASEYNYMKDDINKEISEVLNSGRYLLAGNLEKLEQKISKFAGKKSAVGVKNATDAISLTLLDIYRPNTPVILPNFGAFPTSIATLNVVNKKDVYYVDVDRTMTMDYRKTPNLTNGIVIFVSLFGNNGNIKEIRNYCDVHNHILIVDAAQSAGSGAEKYGDYAIYSFYPTKPLSSYGDGGMIISDRNLKSIRLRRFYGIENNQVVMDRGINSRMDEIQSSVINIKLKYFNELMSKRRKNCNRYLNIVKGIEWKANPVFHQFPLLFRNRKNILEKLKKRDIPYMIHYPFHVTDFNVLKCNNNQVRYRVNDKIVSLPCHPFLKEDHLQKLENFLKDFREEEI